ncbi:MAG: apolipoprotein N-acyltransferase, partial [Desulfovibrio sp.]|nr:apolipoprotein N-acyltransferase [Desulfovibrio sp.]
AVADTRGRLTAMGPLFRAGTLAARARLCSDESRYHRLAPWLPLMAAVVLCGVTLLRRRERA